MPVMNFDLQDGLPPVSFSINGEGAQRFMNFMAECQAIKEAVTQPTDAERYRWLRDVSEPGICAFYLSVGKAFDGVKFARKTVDEAIDAQIAAASAKLVGGGT